MLILFLIVLSAALALMWVRWEFSHRVALGMTGALSVALGVRVIALATALYLFPEFAVVVVGDESDRAAAAGEVQAELAESPDGAVETLALPYAREPVESVAKVVYLAKDRPNWIEVPPTYVGEELQVAVLGGPFVSTRACEKQLGEEVGKTVGDFVNQHLGVKHADTFIHFSLDELRRKKVIREQFQEQLETSLGVMNQVHAQLVFDDQFRDEVELRWSEIRARSRLAQTGLGSGVILLLLGTMFSYFKLDTATKGYYTGRLQFVTAGTILALVAASVLLAKWIPWM